MVKLYLFGVASVAEITKKVEQQSKFSTTNHTSAI